MFSIVHRPTRQTSHVPCGRDGFGSRKNVQLFACILLTDHKNLCILKWNCWLPSNFSITIMYRSQWTRGLRCWPTAARLLGWWVRIPPGHGCLFLVSVVFCRVEASANCRSLLQRSHTDCGVSECDLEASVMRRRWSIRGCCVMGEEKSQNCNFYAYRHFVYFRIWIL